MRRTDFRFFRIIKKKTSGKSYTGDAGSYSYSTPETFFSLEMVCRDGKHMLDTFKSKKEAEYVKSKIEQKIRKNDAYKLQG